MISIKIIIAKRQRAPTGAGDKCAAQVMSQSKSAWRVDAPQCLIE